MQKFYENVKHHGQIKLGNNNTLLLVLYSPGMWYCITKPNQTSWPLPDVSTPEDETTTLSQNIMHQLQ